MIKKIFSVIGLIAWCFCLTAQEKDETPVVVMDENPIDSPIVKSETPEKKTEFHLSAGSSFMYSKSFGSGMSSYIAPELTYKLTPRVHLNAGIMIVNSNLVYNRYQSMANEQSVVVKTKPVTSTLAFISADYLVNDRLSVSGMVIKDLNNPMGQPGYNSIQGMSLHMDYKLTDNITIGAGMHMQQGNGYNPYSNYGLNSFNSYNPLWGY